LAYFPLLSGVLTFTRLLLPIAYQNCVAGLATVHIEIQEAVRMLGGGRLMPKRRVVAALLKRALIAAWVLVHSGLPGTIDGDLFDGPEHAHLGGRHAQHQRGSRLEQLSAPGGVLLLITVAIVVLHHQLSWRASVCPQAICRAAGGTVVIRAKREAAFTTTLASPRAECWPQIRIGKRNGSYVTFDGFEAAGCFERLPADIVNLTFSIRPQVRPPCRSLYNSYRGKYCAANLSW
jgi:hypothetical protein